MKSEEHFESYGIDLLHQKQAIFSSIFVIQNRMQTALEKLHKDISAKQWLLLAMVSSFDGPCTLTNIGKLMGCSRQNVKQLALALKQKDYISLVPGNNNSLCIELTDKAREYAKQMDGINAKALDLLFAGLSNDDTNNLYLLYGKLYQGLKNLEDYAGETKYEGMQYD